MCFWFPSFSRPSFATSYIYSCGSPTFVPNSPVFPVFVPVVLTCLLLSKLRKRLGTQALQVVTSVSTVIPTSPLHHGTVELASSLGFWINKKSRTSQHTSIHIRHINRYIYISIHMYIYIYIYDMISIHLKSLCAFLHHTSLRPHCRCATEDLRKVLGCVFGRIAMPQIVVWSPSTDKNWVQRHWKPSGNHFW